LGLVKNQKAITDWGVWLGSIRKSDKKFYWIDDTPLEGHYSPCGSGQPDSPNSAAEYCSNMFGTGSKPRKWNDLSCSLREAQIKYAPSILYQKKPMELFFFIFTVEIYRNQTWLGSEGHFPYCTAQEVIRLIPDHSVFHLL